MSIFAPVYRPPSGRQSQLALQQKKQRKRKRLSATNDDEPETPPQQSPHPDEATARALSTAGTAFHPVNRTDPYYVAGHARELPLPPGPFPHAAVKHRDRAKGRASVNEELAGLNPPVYVSARETETSLRRRHADNITTILHRCMLSDDWRRASRAWALLVRTEIAGRGIDVRRNGRWGIGAEILMRREAQKPKPFGSKPPESDEEDLATEPVGVEDEQECAFNDEGFQLAREYYERLILQYPHTPRTQHTVNATVFYPALFNVWIYQVQARSKSARAELARLRPLSSDSSASDTSTLHSEVHQRMLSIRKRELEDALPIAQRMDELLLSPPYDSSPPLMRLRGMVGLWLSDLHAQLTGLTASSDDEVDVRHYSLRSETNPSQNAANLERKTALRLLQKTKDGGEQLPIDVLEMLENEKDEMSE